MTAHFPENCFSLRKLASRSTVLVLEETEQQPSMLPAPAVPGCCLVSFHFLSAILSTSTVVSYAESSFIYHTSSRIFEFSISHYSNLPPIFHAFRRELQPTHGVEYAFLKLHPLPPDFQSKTIWSSQMWENNILSQFKAITAAEADDKNIIFRG